MPNVIPWVPLHDRESGITVWVNIDAQSVMKHHPGPPAFTRIWSGDTAAVVVDGAPQIVPFFTDVQETPEQVFMKLYGAIPGEFQ